MKKTIFTVIGARPQFIKASAVSLNLMQRSEFEEYIVHTGQHYDANMSEVFFRELGIPEPKINLEIGSGAHGSQTARMLEALEREMMHVQPALVLVYGDTNSTMAGALAAVKLHIPVAHVESGLRSFNRVMPEEINRIVTDHVSDILFAPSEVALTNLEHEGISKEKSHLVGDVMYDVALKFGELAAEKSCILDRLGLQPGGYVLATVHRAENTDSEMKLAGIFEGLAAISQQMPVVVPLHPRSRDALRNMTPNNNSLNKLHIMEPVGYLDMVALERSAKTILTDSGGVQKEAYFYHVPCITLREETEWVELVKHGFNRLAGSDPEHIKRVFELVVHEPLPDFGVFLYGRGDAGLKIVDILATFDL